MAYISTPLAAPSVGAIPCSYCYDDGYGDCFGGTFSTTACSPQVLYLARDLRLDYEQVAQLNRESAESFSIKLIGAYGMHSAHKYREMLEKNSNQASLGPGIHLLKSCKDFLRISTDAHKKSEKIKSDLANLADIETEVFMSVENHRDERARKLEQLPYLHAKRDAHKHIWAYIGRNSFAIAGYSKRFRKTLKKLNLQKSYFRAPADTPFTPEVLSAIYFMTRDFGIGVTVLYEDPAIAEDFRKCQHNVCAALYSREIY